MAVPNSVVPSAWLAEQIQHGDPDLLRFMVKTMAETLMSADADTLCGAKYGTRGDEPTNSRNGYRIREWDTRAGTVELAIPKLRSGSYFPDRAAIIRLGGAVLAEQTNEWTEAYRTWDSTSWPSAGCASSMATHRPTTRYHRHLPLDLQKQGHTKINSYTTPLDVTKLLMLGTGSPEPLPARLTR